MDRHFTYLHSIFSFKDGEVYEKFTFGILLGIVMIFLAFKASKKIRNSKNVDDLVLPESRFNLFGFFDLLVGGFIKFQDSILGKENRKYLGLCGSVFLFVFFANILGLVPGMPAITTTVTIDAAIAIVVFIAFNAYGVKENGFFGYLKHFCGGSQMLKFPLVLLVPVLFSVEIISTTLRILTLNLRLYWNITADHTVLSIFTMLRPEGVPIFFYLMGTFISFMQAFIFTVLTMIYILLATSHEEH